MAISQQKIEEIKSKNDIVEVVSQYLDLTKKGRNYWGICPFHDDTSPSMSISPEKQIYKCFVCGAGGTVIDFVSEHEGLAFLPALKQLGQRVGIEIQYQESNKIKYSQNDMKLIEILKEANNFFQYSLSSEEGKEAAKYIKARGLDQNEINTFLIGYAPQDHNLIDFLKKKNYDESLIINASLATEKMYPFYKNRLTFGITNNDGDIVGFSARKLSGNGPKYINSLESNLFNKSQILYNYANAKLSIKRTREIIITEGFLDVIALNKAEIKNSVAIMGIALTIQHLPLLKGNRVILMLDTDMAGINATIKSIKLLLESKIEVFVVKNTSNLDPDEYLRKYGKEKLRILINNRQDALEFIWEIHLKSYGKNSPSNIIKFIDSFVKYLVFVENTYKDYYLSKIEKELGISKETIAMKIPTSSLHYKPQTLTKGERYVAAERNYSYTLIKSMIKNPKFIDIFDKEEVIFTDPMLIAIGKYLVKYKNSKIKEKPTLEVKQKIQEILLTDNQVETKEEFNNIIKLINEVESIQVLSEKLEHRIANSNDSIENARLMDEFIKTRKRKGNK